MVETGVPSCPEHRRRFYVIDTEGVLVLGGFVWLHRPQRPPSPAPAGRWGAGEVGGRGSREGAPQAETVKADSWFL